MAKKDYRGMTVNERLWDAGLDVAFDKAKAFKDVEKMRDIAARVNLWMNDDGMFWDLDSYPEKKMKAEAKEQ